MNGGPTILIAEDDASIRSLLCEALADAGYTVLACRSAAQACALLRRTTPHLVLTDLHMEAPAAGVTVLHELRARFPAPAVPAILASADHAALCDPVVQRALHGVQVMHKPFDILGLLTTVAALLMPTAREHGGVSDVPGSS